MKKHGKPSLSSGVWPLSKWVVTDGRPKPPLSSGKLLCSRSNTEPAPGLPSFSVSLLIRGLGVIPLNVQTG